MLACLLSHCHCICLSSSSSLLPEMLIRWQWWCGCVRSRIYSGSVCMRHTNINIELMWHTLWQYTEPLLFYYRIPQLQSYSLLILAFTIYFMFFFVLSPSLSHSLTHTLYFSSQHINSTDCLWWDVAELGWAQWYIFNFTRQNIQCSHSILHRVCALLKQHCY